ncbi:hypothetical protein CEE35_07735 [Candidatus Aerophobetes bacterium Ae_b3b]|nr:MAG: hypothetical protein CEE35_07735 [Candidatus Aerophobetes bacterium Ae_b3b]
MPCKVPPAIMETVCAVGEKKTKMTWNRVLILGFLAGAYVAFGGFLAVIAAAGDPWPRELPGLQKLVFGAVFPVGLMLVVIGGAELFTGNCMLPTVACLNNRGSWKGLVRNWTGSYMGNFMGGIFVAYFLGIGTGLLLKDPWMSYIAEIAQAKCKLSFTQAFLRGVGCNWLVCLAIWLALGSDNIIGKVFAIQFPIMAFVTLGFEHSVANMFFIPAGMFITNKITWGMFLFNNLLPVTLGNIVGGAFFVGMLYYYLYGKKKRRWPLSIALVGVGKSGRVLLNNLTFEKNGFHIQIGFDVNPNKIGRRIAGVKVYHPYRMPKIIRKQKIHIGMITAPAEAAQESADLLVISGIKGILNFSCTRVIVPSYVKLKNVDFTSQLEIIPNYIVNNRHFQLSTEN